MSLTSQFAPHRIDSGAVSKLAAKEGRKYADFVFATQNGVGRYEK